MKLEFFERDAYRAIETRLKFVDVVHKATNEVLCTVPLECVFYKEDENDFQFRCVGITSYAVQVLDNAIQNSGKWENDYFIKDYEIWDETTYPASDLKNKLYIVSEWEL